MQEGKKEIWKNGAHDLLQWTGEKGAIGGKGFDLVNSWKKCQKKFWLTKVYCNLQFCIFKMIPNTRTTIVISVINSSFGRHRFSANTAFHCMHIFSIFYFESSLHQYRVLQYCIHKSGFRTVFILFCIYKYNFIFLFVSHQNPDFIWRGPPLFGKKSSELWHKC